MPGNQYAYSMAIIGRRASETFVLKCSTLYGWSIKGVTISRINYCLTNGAKASMDALYRRDCQNISYRYSMLDDQVRC